MRFHDRKNRSVVQKQNINEMLPSQEMYDTISNTANFEEEAKDSEFLHNNLDDWRESDLFLPGNTYTLAHGSYETLGCGMHYGTVHTFADLRVEKDGYHFSGEPAVVAFGYFIYKTYEEIEAFLVSCLLSSHVVPSQNCNMHELVCKLRTSDIFNKTQIDAKIALLQEKKELYNNLSMLRFIKKQKIAREIRKINEDLALFEQPPKQ